MNPITKAIQGMAHRHSPHHIFSDFIEMGAIAVSNAVDKDQSVEREARYMQIVGKYSKDEPNKIAELLGMLIMELERNPRDVLGETFHELELHNTYKGQFFTPYPICRMMSEMTFFKDDAQGKIDQRGYIRAAEPSCGSGAMVIGLADVMKSNGINYQQYLHVTATDLDSRCVHMAYLQLSLMHIPAVIVHGNTLSLEEFGHWYTPAHFMGLWDWKLKRERAIETIAEITEPVAVPVTEQIKPVAKPKSYNPQQLTLF
jgi:hypothetical protein